MKRLAIMILVTALGVAAVATAAQATGMFGLHTTPTVTPARGTPTTTFTVRFRTPVATGASQGLRSWETASVVDQGGGSRSCTANLAVRLPPAVAHHHVSVSLSSPATSWCAGKYAGTITLYRSLACGPSPVSGPKACPEIAFVPEAIGHFRFTVAPS